MKVETGTVSPMKDLDRVPAPNGPQKRALVVNYEPATSVLIQEVLVSTGIDAVILANNGDADVHFQKEKFDVVFVDPCMPSEDGNELVRKIRQSSFNQKTPIVMISQDQRPGALARGFEAGASFFVYKPIDRARLVKLIRVTQGTVDQERRRFRRVQVQAKVRLKTDKTEVEGETVDISMNGALVTAPRTIPVGSFVEVSLYLLAGAAPIVGLGTVARVLSSTQMGILLDRLSVAESGRLQEYLLPRIDA